MADVPLMFPSPKQSFLADEKQCRRHLDFLASENLQHSLNVSLAQQQWQLCHSEVADPSARFYMMRGALHFLEIFHNLATHPQVPSKPKAADLDHGA